MADPAPFTAIPGLIRATHAAAVAHAPRGGMADAWMAGLVGYLILAELAAEQLAAMMPPAEHRGQQQHHAPLGERPRAPGFGDPEAVDMRTGLPPGRYHP